MEIERNYYTEALHRIQAEAEQENEKENAELRQALLALEECGEQHPPVPNEEKQKWFEDLAARALRFAKVCDLDVRIRTIDDVYGVIRFASSFFELSWLEPQEIHDFWIYLCSKGEMKISHAPEVFVIEFWYALFDNK